MTEVKPFRNSDGTYRIDGVLNGLRNATDIEYHESRAGIMRFKDSDPNAFKLFEQSLSGKNLNSAQQQQLTKAFEKFGLAGNQLTLTFAVGKDLQANQFDPSYRPLIQVDINGRAMSPNALTQAFAANKIQFSGTSFISESAGKLNGSGLVINVPSVQTALSSSMQKDTKNTKIGIDYILNIHGSNGANMLAQIGHHVGGLAKLFPGIGKVANGAALSLLLAGVANAKTPEERNEALRNLGQAALETVDPTSGIISNGLPLVVDDIKRNGGRRREEARANPQNLAITRAQEFLLNPNHPDQLGALKMVGKDGKPLDIPTALKDPSQQAIILAEITTLRARATSPEGKELFDNMHAATMEFIRLEKSRPSQPAAATTAATTAPARENFNPSI